jgi:hypothetical protein
MTNEETENVQEESVVVEELVVPEKTEELTLTLPLNIQEKAILDLFPSYTEKYKNRDAFAVEVSLIFPTDEQAGITPELQSYWDRFDGANEEDRHEKLAKRLLKALTPEGYTLIMGTKENPITPYITKRPKKEVLQEIKDEEMALMIKEAEEMIANAIDPEESIDLK